jgi:flavin reductase (DIM6/NTAB) family NADH-FMN oxidoreductase RutF
MAKVIREPFRALYPAPLALLTCRDRSGQPNVMTVAWMGTVASVPPCVAVGVRPYRYSHAAIKEQNDFVINIPDQDLLNAVDYCGRISRYRTGDKFAEAGLTPVPASKVASPIISECPVNIECQVIHALELDSHTLFVGEIVAVQVNEELLGAEGFIEHDRTRPLIYMGNEYWSLGERLANAGFTFHLDTLPMEQGRAED